MPNASNLLGLCCFQADCARANCPGREIAQQAASTQCTCSLQLATCETPQACQQPLADLRPIDRRLFTRRRRFDIQLPTTREQWGRCIGAVLGIAGTAFIIGAVGRHLGILG